MSFFHLERIGRYIGLRILTTTVALAQIAYVAPAQDASSADEPIVVAQASKKSSSSSKKSSSSSSSKKSSSKSKSSSSKSKSSSKESSSRKTSTPKPPEPTTYSLQTIGPAMQNAVAGVSKLSKWGIKVVMLESGQPVFDMNSDIGFIPASTRKLFTGALALDQLGPDFEFRTYLYHTGTIDSSGTLNGNLIIRPQGDPTFSNRIYPSQSIDWVYRDWVDKVQAANIGFVNGELLIDCSDWDMADLQPKGWAARIMGDTYAPRTSPLTLNENIIGIKVKPGDPGKPGIVEFQPEALGYPVDNQTVTGGKGSISLRYNEDGRIRITGNPNNKSYGIPCDNPTLFAAAVFRFHLHKAGIPINGSVRIVTKKRSLPPPTTENVVALYPSPPLSELVKTMMKKSNNHFAEQLYVAVSAVKTGNGGYTASKQLETELHRKAGIDPKTIRVEDGSGLSEANAISPGHMCSLLGYMTKHPSSQAFFDSLPIGGEDGTLRRRMHDDDVHGKVHAKTGHINRVSTLAGYIMIAPQQTAVFAFLVNESKTSAVDGVQDRLCEIVSKLRP